MVSVIENHKTNVSSLHARMFLSLSPVNFRVLTIRTRRRPDLAHPHHRRQYSDSSELLSIECDLNELTFVLRLATPQRRSSQRFSVSPPLCLSGIRDLTDLCGVFCSSSELSLLQSIQPKHPERFAIIVRIDSTYLGLRTTYFGMARIKRSF